MNISPLSRAQTLSLAGAAVALAFVSIHRSQAEPAPAGVQSAEVKGSVHSITVMPMQHDMPAGPNKEVYDNNCATCHSTRYVTMQPKFTRKTWEAEVTKMANVYGAPVAPDQQKLIVDYLMAVRGKPDAPADTKTAGGDSSATKSK